LNRRSNTWNVSLVHGTFDLNLCENWRSYYTKKESMAQNDREIGGIRI